MKNNISNNDLDISTLNRKAAKVDLSKSNIKDISFLEEFQNLEDLFLLETSISDLSVLRLLPKLRRLFLQRSDIADLTDLSESYNLEYLWLDQTQVSDLSPLSNLIKLTAIGARGTKIYDLEPIRMLENLTILELNDTLIKDLTPIASLKYLSTLQIKGTTSIDFSPLSELRSLETLDVSNTNISDLSCLKHAYRLNWLNISDTNIDTIYPIDHLIGISPLMADNMPHLDQEIQERNERLQKVFSLHDYTEFFDILVSNLPKTIQSELKESFKENYVECHNHFTTALICTLNNTKDHKNRIMLQVDWKAPEEVDHQAQAITTTYSLPIYSPSKNNIGSVSAKIGHFQSWLKPHNYCYLNLNNYDDSFYGFVVPRELVGSLRDKAYQLNIPIS